MSQKLALRLVPETISNVFSEGYYVEKIPKIHVKSFKTVDARASGLHFITPS